MALPRVFSPKIPTSKPELFTTFCRTCKRQEGPCFNKANVQCDTHVARVDRYKDGLHLWNLARERRA